MIGVIGYLCEDFFPEFTGAFRFVPGKLQEIKSLPCSPGGVVGNTGGALCKLKVPVRLAVLTGDDATGTLLRSVMAEYAPPGGAVNVILPGQPSGTSIVLNPPGEDRMFLCCRGVNDLLTADTFPESFYEGLDVLHYGYPTLSLGMAADGGAETVKLFARCRAKGILTSLDLSLPDPATPFFRMDWEKFLGNVLPLTDFFCPSIDELRCTLRDEASTPEALADRVLALGCGAVLLKLGGDGLLLKTADTSKFAARLSKFGPGAWRRVSCFVPPEKIRVVNGTGAGDTAIAGFLAGVTTGADAATAARLAAKTAAARIASPHGISDIPSLPRILMQLNPNRKG